MTEQRSHHDETSLTRELRADASSWRREHPAPALDVAILRRLGASSAVQRRGPVHVVLRAAAVLALVGGAAWFGAHALESRSIPGVAATPADDPETTREGIREGIGSRQLAAAVLPERLGGLAVAAVDETLRAPLARELDEVVDDARSVAGALRMRVPRSIRNRLPLTWWWE